MTDRDGLLVTARCPRCRTTVLRVYEGLDGRLLVETRKPVMRPPAEVATLRGGIDITDDMSLDQERRFREWFATKPAQSRVCVTEEEWLDSERILVACFRCPSEHRRVWAGTATPLHIDADTMGEKLRVARRLGPVEILATIL